MTDKCKYCGAINEQPENEEATISFCEFHGTVCAESAAHEVDLSILDGRDY